MTDQLNDLILDLIFSMVFEESRKCKNSILAFFTHSSTEFRLFTDIN
jgi:hypothetical protein